MTFSAPAPLTSLPEWQDFCQASHSAQPDESKVRILTAAGLHADFSGQRYSQAWLEASIQLLEARGFSAQRDALLHGGVCNPTEQRAAWHTALRSPSAPKSEITVERERMNAFVRDADAARRWRHIVHIGIGGSDWGVRLSVSAFGYNKLWRTVRFVANIDGHAMEGALADLNPHDTLFVVASKSFTTVETLENAARGREWLAAAGIKDPSQHFAAITARPDAAQRWGVPEGQIFRLWDWVGGRFSLWSAVSLTTALAVSSDVVAGMLTGAAAMDTHFSEAPLAQNVPVQMAMVGIMNRSVLGFGSLNIAPYDFRLGNLVPYLQQLDMESLGKSVDLNGDPITVPTGPAVWGMPGTDAQHTFFQWLHQSSEGAPVDFIVCQHADHKWPSHHDTLLAHCLAQREAMLRGKSYEQALAECQREGLSEERARWLAHHRVHQGGRPNTLIVLPRLTPYSLGALLALYEHKIFTQGLVWGINPFDQWGVEYGKVLAAGILQEIQHPTGVIAEHDASTNYWVNRFARPLRSAD